VSVINKMLQDLDRRNAVAMSADEAGPQAVKPVVEAQRRRHEWFWRVLAGLVLISVGWVGWVAYQLQPRALVTPLALLAAEQSAARSAAAERPAQRPVPAPLVVPSVVATPVVEAHKAEPALSRSEPAKPVETLKLARSIDTPIREPRPKRAEPQARKLAAEPAALPAAPGPTKAVVDKREHSKAADDAAEARFRRAAALLNQGRISEAEEELAAALQADPSHVPARQAYVALLLEQQRVASALRLLREAVDANPGQPLFSLGLARVYAEQRDYPAALSVIEKSGRVGQGPDFQVLKGAVLQRLGRHDEAVTAYEEALQKSSQPGSAWAGLGVSLEAVGRQGDAAQAYRRALGAGPLAPELRNYAEERIRALQ
jgi:MSHA biogenesis protein MshN